MSANASRLARNFHKTFKPERQYINALLRFAAAGKAGDSQSIAAETGIPTGKSSGKVPAIVDYCRGMGLISLVGAPRSAVKRFELTPFGRVVFFEDPYLKLPITQWLAHFQLCSPLHGAEVWYQTFFPGKQRLGMTFTRTQLENYLVQMLDCPASGIIGPMVGMYEDNAAFGACGALSENGDVITRQPTPIRDEFGYGLGAWLLRLIELHFPKNEQLSVVELDQEAGWKSIPGWDVDETQRVLALIEQKGLIGVDRHMQPWLIHPKKSADAAWKMIYDDMI